MQLLYTKGKGHPISGHEDPEALDGVGGQRQAPAALTPGKTRYSLCRRLGGPQGRSGRAENVAATGIRSPDRPARIESLYRLSHPGPPTLVNMEIMPVSDFIQNRQ